MPKPEGRTLQVSKPIVEIGRDPKNGIDIDSLFVSRFHARIEKLPSGELILHDLGSAFR